MIITKPIRQDGGRIAGFALNDKAGREIIRVRRLKNGDWTAYHLSSEEEGRKWRERFAVFDGLNTPLSGLLEKATQYLEEEMCYQRMIDDEIAREFWRESREPS